MDRGSEEMIREVELKDAKEIQKIYSHYVENTTISFEYDAPDEKEIERRIRHYRRDYPYIVIEKEGRVLGYAYASRYRKRKAYDHTAEISVYVGKEEIGKGYGKMLTKELLKRLREKGTYTAIAVATAGNERSNRLFLSMGFKQAGSLDNVGYKNGKWVGILEFILPLRKYD